MFFLSLLLLLLFSPICVNAENIEKTDIIAFSYDRPLQLYALVESIEKYVTGVGTITIIYRASSDEFERGYQEVCYQFEQVKLVRQLATKEKNNFYELTLNAVNMTKTEYLLFAVDDNIVKDYINLNQDASALENFNAHGFFYRLGLHLTHCYPYTKPNNPQAGRQLVPSLSQHENDIYSWDYKKGTFDWGYPNNVDMTLYRTSYVKQMINGIIRFSSPNFLEDHWAHTVPARTICLCHTTSKIVNIPINMVQTDFANQNMSLYTTAELLTLFLNGSKIDIAPLHQIQNRSAHIDYEPQFIRR